MQHSNDNVFNILKNAKAMIDSSDKGSQKLMKSRAFKIASKYEKEFGKKLADMAGFQIEVIEDELFCIFS